MPLKGMSFGHLPAEPEVLLEEWGGDVKKFFPQWRDLRAWQR
jgi:hypothetical protein